ncbi:hypothetical protein EUGRSUZ_B00958 [Eucalyptus grandis]|uniref:Uncharacterized protein n=2 Tax=Eucalyptus grandis TaxID=71139 RepID=A0ACC3LQT3_EUCGR|nr:hypothetical protein EUGRSUZ_B00958 [Eucalyptus grandis]
MVKVESLSSNGGVTASSSYLTTLPFKSQRIHFAETFLNCAPHTVGLQSESQVLNIHMTEHINAPELTSCLKVVEARADNQLVVASQRCTPRQLSSISAPLLKEDCLELA